MSGRAALPRDMNRSLEERFTVKDLAAYLYRVEKRLFEGDFDGAALVLERVNLVPFDAFLADPSLLSGDDPDLGGPDAGDKS